MASRDLYRSLGTELRQFLKELAKDHNPSLLLSKMQKILQIAAQIAPSLLDEAKKLQLALQEWGTHLKDVSKKEEVKKRALHLEQETKEI